MLEWLVLIYHLYMSFFLPESESFSRIVESLKGESVLVLGHRRPDGDCIGSQVALTRILIQKGINAGAVNSDPVPRTLEKFVGDTPWLRMEDIQNSDSIIITVDCADQKRVGEDLAGLFPNVFLNVDHHVSNTGFAKHNYVLSEASATCEILAKFFIDSDFKIDETTANALFLGICTDTGQFCYSGTNASVFEVCRRLCEFGCNPALVAQELYEREKPGRIQLLQKFLASFRMEFEQRVCIGSIHESFYHETGTKPEDAENFVDYARSLEGVEIGVLIEDRNGKLKGSFRSKEKIYRVDLLAKQFSGGGHACAAGFNLEMSFDDFYPKLLGAIEGHLEFIKNKGVE